MGIINSLRTINASEAIIPAGKTQILARVQTTQDDIDELVEKFTLTADITSGNTTNVSSTGTASILDNDCEPQIVISDSSVNEEDGLLTFVVSLSNPSSNVVTVNYVTADGTAISGSDYVSSTGTITFAPGETSKIITVAVLDDNVFENPESMYVNLLNPTNSTIADAQGEGRILDNADKPSLSVSTTEVVEGGYHV